MSDRYFKVVKSPRNGVYKSASTISEHEIVYPLDEWVYPKIDNSRIFIFKEFVDAEQFCIDYCMNPNYTCV